MRGMSKHNTKLCIYCGKEADTDEHIPPKNLFPPGYRDDLISVPACDSCNKSYTLDDEYFRDVLARWEKVINQPSSQYIQKNFLASLKKPQQRGKLIQLYDSLTTVDVTTKAGIFVSRKPGYRVDLDRIECIIRKIVRGLFYVHENKFLLEDDIVIRGPMLQNCPPDKIVPWCEMLLQESCHQTGKGIFQYRYKVFENGIHSIWLLSFYGVPLFIGIIVKKEVEGEK